jgi:hypothetical protein
MFFDLDLRSVVLPSTPEDVLVAKFLAIWGLLLLASFLGYVVWKVS